MAITAIKVIRDENDEFFAWASAGEGYFLDNRAGNMVLHRATCPHFKGKFDPPATRNPKFLAADRRDPEQVSPGAVPCPDCRL